MRVDERLAEQGRRIGDLSWRFDRGFTRIDERLDGLHRLLVRISVGGFVTVLVALLISHA